MRTIPMAILGATLALTSAASIAAAYGNADIKLPRPAPHGQTTIQAGADIAQSLHTADKPAPSGAGGDFGSCVAADTDLDALAERPKTSTGVYDLLLGKNMSARNYHGPVHGDEVMTG